MTEPGAVPSPETGPTPDAAPGWEPGTPAGPTPDVAPGWEPGTPAGPTPDAAPGWAPGTPAGPTPDAAPGRASRTPGGPTPDAAPGWAPGTPAGPTPGAAPGPTAGTVSGPASTPALPAAGPDARARVLAAVARAAATVTLRPPALLAARPLRPLPPPLAARLAERAAAGLDADGTGRPRLFARDPLRLTRAQRRAVAHSRSWESPRTWIGAHAGRRERSLVAVASDIVARICATVAWGSPQLAGHRDRLDLGAELDQIDAQAFALTSVPESDARVEQQWLATVDRVAALDTYAAQLVALDRHLAVLDHADRVGERISDLAPGAVRDGYARDQVGVLVEELTALSSAVAEIADAGRTGGPAGREDGA